VNFEALEIVVGFELGKNGFYKECEKRVSRPDKQQGMLPFQSKPFINLIQNF
jgi:hypothetical protein